jgi:gluconokinase
MTVVVVAGVAGSGKTEVGRELARRMASHFVDADSFHTSGSVRRMRRGQSLSESERQAWLTRLTSSVRGRDPLVIACSALRRSHRDRLRTLGDVRVVMLDVPENELRRRLEARSGHFFPVTLLEDQLATFERPTTSEDVLVVPGDTAVTEVASRILAALRS